MSYENDRRRVAGGSRSVMRVPLTNAGKRLGSVLRAEPVRRRQRVHTLVEEADMLRHRGVSSVA